MNLLDRARRVLGRSPVRFDPRWEPMLEAGFDHWSTLDEAERARLRELVARFVHRTRWEAARGMDLTEDVRVVIAAQASLLLLGLEIDEYPTVSSVIVHRSTVRLHGDRPVGGGTWSSGPHHLSGQATPRGPVVLSWAAVRAGARRPDRGQNVVYHEFAHVLDMLDGMTDGTPPLGDDGAAERWREVCTAAFERVRDGDSVLRAYAGTNPAEFFATATELFFTRPVDLAEHEPALYGELRRFYRQDPARRRRVADARREASDQVFRVPRSL